MDTRWIETLSITSPLRRSVPCSQEDLPTSIALNSRRAPLGGLIMEFAGVLYDDTAWQRWLLQQLARIGLQTHYGPFFRVFERDYLPEVHCGRDYWDALREFLIGSGLTPGQMEEVETAGRSRFRQLESDIRPLPGVASTLAKLAAHKFPMVILSNSHASGEELERRLRQMGLADRFAAILSSRDLGQRKPDEASFRAALCSLRLASPDVGFVGRNQEELRGASRLGLTTIAVNYEQGTHADLLLDRFDQLLDAVRSKSNTKLAG